MYILGIVFITIVMTFLLTYMFKKTTKTVDKNKSAGLHIHHSVLGIIVLAAGLVLTNQTMSAIGLGIYLAHGFEEIYFNKRNPFKAFLIFVTR